ncbi:kynureninase [Listeria booriae]|uniref:kynureninase n=1 Tax=Listeria booriae TaxID=1552123 RepID=UPI001629BC51|nr:kynureninase [Listeria booriae]MBC1892851.1 kynureninase [Listeria booriae]MBC1899014.1 kynureninase [Listeria booriae]MBC1976433.1 kynureninase [Listeria booriae]MBC1985329.1 kynureninase [Listeria booriae]MBC2025387.1 kynureninase [Listeria booriae]
MRHFEDGIAFARKKDEEDVLFGMRERFCIQPGELYMDGNSLGMASKDAKESLYHVIDLWEKHGINIWEVENSKYFLYQNFLGDRVAKLIGAKADEVTIMTNTTVNIHKGISTFYHPTKERYKILVDDLNFPTDRYAIDSQVKLKGYDPKDAVKVVKSADGRLIDEDAIIEAMTDDVLICFLPAVLYRSAQLLDMERVTAEAHKRGIIIGWDLCHSIGSVPHDFAAIDPDFAVWCSYKYLSAGPGAIAGFYMNSRHFDKEPGLTGWFGNKNETQFQLRHEFDKDPTAHGWQTGTQPLFSMAPMEGILNIYEEAGMEQIRAKSLDITAYLMYLIEEKLSPYGYSIGNPREDSKRGGHVCLEHEEAYRICKALKENHVIPDFREPNVIRLAPVALYISYEEVYNLIDILAEIVETKAYEKMSHERSLVV